MIEILRKCLNEAWPEFNVILVFALIALATRYFYTTGLYWFRKKVPGPIPLPYIGNYFPRWMATMSIVDYDHRYYSDYGGKRFCGFFEFQRKTIMIGDLELLTHILIKDFDNFVNRSKTSIADPIVDKMLFVMEDSTWKSMRSILTPTFSSGKIKNMTPLILQISDKLPSIIFPNDEMRSSQQELCSLFRKFAIEVIATIAFGMETNALNLNKDEFTTNARKIFTSLNRKERFIAFFALSFPKVAKMLNYNLRDKEAPLFFKKVIEENLRARKAQGVKRLDFLNMLEECRLKEQEESAKTGKNPMLTEEAFMAQCIMFFAAGVDTVSTTLALFFHSLAIHPSVQTKLLNEIDSVLNTHDGKITYEAMQEMKYLDMVLKETQRLYPSAPRTYRVTEAAYKLPGTDVILEPDTTIVIPIRCIHYDPEYYLDPTSFNPERFSNDNTAKRHPMSFLPFGQGPRNCIGLRFALLEMKACIVSILRENCIKASSNTKNPIQQDKVSGVLKVSGGVWCDIERRTEAKEER